MVRLDVLYTSNLGSSPSGKTKNLFKYLVMVIYCITNLINNKKYVGKTMLSIQERWRKHCQDSKREKCEKRPLYSAFNKYGIENFKIECLEEIDDPQILSEREIYWINELESYGNKGYNATKGGDGKILYDYKEIIELYNLGYSCIKVAEKIGCHQDTVRTVLKAHGIKIRSGNAKRIDQFDKAGNYIQHFWGSVEAAEWLVENGLAKSKSARRHITECCSGKTKSAYGYVWKYGVLPD